MICRAERAKHFKNRKCTILLQRSLYALELKIWNITILFIKCCKSSLHTSCFLPPLSPTLTHTPATRADRLQSMRTRGLTRAWGEERLQGGGGGDWLTKTVRTKEKPCSYGGEGGEGWSSCAYVQEWILTSPRFRPWVQDGTSGSSVVPRPGKS